MTKSVHAPLSEREESIAKDIVDCAFKVHQGLGPGLLESVYELCFYHELTKHGMMYQKQVVVPVVYDGLTFNEALRLDVIVEQSIICELKAVETLLAVHEAQLLSYLRLTGKRIGFLINFNVPLIKKWNSPLRLMNLCAPLSLCAFVVNNA